MDKTDILRRLLALRPINNLSAFPPAVAGGEENSSEDDDSNEIGNPLELENLVAGKPIDSAEDVVPGDDSLPVSKDSSTIVTEDIKTFQQAGWRFKASSDAEAFFEVVLDEDGHLKLVGKALTVKLNPAFKIDDAKSLFKSHGLILRRKIGFARNTFLLESPEMSAVDAALQLNANDDVLYAEPSFVEPIKGRR